MAAFAWAMPLAGAAQASEPAEGEDAPAAAVPQVTKAPNAQVSAAVLPEPAGQGFAPALPSVQISRGIGRVTVSRASDAPGRTVYAARHSFSGSDRLVAFSTRPVPVLRPTMLASSVASLSAITLPGQLPLRAAALTSGFGARRHPVLGGFRTHSGVDLAAPIGTPVFATSDGTVSAAGWRGGYGLLVALDHGGVVQTRYGHLSQLSVAEGQQVRKGDLVGFVGSTGMSTGPHLHYEIRANGRAVNPLGH